MDQLDEAKAIISTIVKPSVLEHMQSKAPNIKRTRYDIVPLVSGLNWEIIFDRMFTMNVLGERPVPNSERIKRVEIYFGLVFLPEGFRPDIGVIKTVWENGVVLYDEDMFRGLIDKFLCKTCDGISGQTCRCNPKARLTEIDLGGFRLRIQKLTEDVAKTLTELAIPKQQCGKIAEQAAKEFAEKSKLPTDQDFIRRCLQIYRENYAKKL